MIRQEEQANQLIAVYEENSRKFPTPWREQELIDYDKFLWLLQQGHKGDEIPSDLYVSLRLAMDAAKIDNTPLNEIAEQIANGNAV